jgi:hypothetical protein
VTLKKATVAGRQVEARRLLSAFGVMARVGDRDIVIDASTRRELAWAAAYLLKAKYPAAQLQGVGDKIYVRNYIGQWGSAR